jgi:hypothetical protein
MPTKLFSFSLLFLALTGCGQIVVPTGTPVVPDPVVPALATHSATCTALFDAYAKREQECVGTPISAALRDDLVVHCSAREALPGISVAPSAFLECAKKIAVSSCASLPLECLSPEDGSAQTTLTWLGGSVAPFYYEVFPRVAGALLAGKSCSIGAQCASGTCSSNDTCGFCIDYRKAGESCDVTSPCLGSECVAGTCVEMGTPLGGACQDIKGDSDCLSSLYCKDSVCVPRLQVGDSCVDGYLPICAQGAICSASTCQIVKYVKEGEACDEGIARCGAEGAECVDGVCRTPVDNVPVGGSCWVDTCAVGLHCSAWLCVTPSAPGGPCVDVAGCMTGLACLGTSAGAGHCGAPLLEGADCMAQGECASGLGCEFTKDPSGTCKPYGTSTLECGETSPCGGTEVCRGGECRPLDLCSAP